MSIFSERLITSVSIKIVISYDSLHGLKLILRHIDAITVSFYHKKSEDWAFSINILEQNLKRI